MTDLRTAAQQALEALELAQTDVHWELNSPTRKFLRKAEKTLRAALAQQDAPVQEPVKFWPLAPLTGYYDVGGKRVWLEKDEPFPAPPRCPNCASLEAQNTELDRKLAELERAESAQEPVDVGLLEYQGNSVAFIHQKMTAYRTGIDAAWDAFKAKGLHPDGKTSLADMIAKYTAPPQRLPQTIDESMRLPRAMAQAYESGYKAGQTHERKRIIQFLQEMQRQVGDGHNHYGVAAVQIRERA